MNNLLELVLAVFEVLAALRTKTKPVQVTAPLREELATIRGLVVHRGVAEPEPFENGAQALEWVRTVVQWDLVTAVMETMLGKQRGTAGGPLFWQGFVQTSYDAFDLAAPAKPDARAHAKVMIEVGQAQSMFQIWRAAQFEDLVTKAIEEFAKASAED